MVKQFSYARLIPALLGIFLFAASQAFGQAQFQLRLGNAGDNEGASSVIQTADGNYAFSGYTDASGTLQPLLVKVGSNGNLFFTQRYDLGGPALAKGLRQTDDGGYVIAGDLTATGGNLNIFVIKTDAAGNVQWTTILDNSADDGTHDDPVIQTSDGGYLVVGHTTITGGGCAGQGCRETYVVKLNSTGAVQWENYYPIFSDFDYASGAVEDGGNYFVVGHANNIGAGVLGGTLLELDNTGAVQNVDFIRRNVGIMGFSTIRTTTTANQFVVGGFSSEGGLAGTGIDPAMFVLNSNGTIANSIANGGTNPAENLGLTAVQVNDGGYVGATTTNVNGADQNILVYKLDDAGVGTLEWEQEFGSATAIDTAIAAFPTTDGGIIVAGMSQGFGAGDDDVLIIKVNVTGGSSCNDLPDNTTNSTLTVFKIDQNVTPTATTAASSPVTNQNFANLDIINPCCINYSASVSANDVCEGQPSNLVPNIQPSINNVELEWDLDNDGVIDTTNNGTLITNLSAGTYDITMIATDTLTNCVDTATVTHTVNPIPTADAGVDQVICEIDTATLFGSGTGNVQWNVLSGTPASLGSPTSLLTDAYPLVTSQYELVITDAIGCEDRDTVSVTVNPIPTVDAGPDTLLCLGQSVQLSASGAINYSWSPGDSLSATNIPDPVANPSVSTIYTVTGTDAIGCSDTAQVVVGVVNITLGTDDTVTYCSNTPGVDISANIVGGSGCTFTWSPTTNLTVTGPGTATVNPPADTFYEVEVDCNTGGTTCSDTDTVYIDVQAPPTPGISPDTLVCVNDTLQLTATGGDTYEWLPTGPIVGSNQLQTITIVPVGDVTFQATVTDTITGCSESATVDITTFTAPSINLGPDTTICEGGVVIRAQPDTFDTYQWTPPGSMLAGNDSSFNSTMFPQDTTEFFLTVTDSIGCTATDSITVNVIESPTAFIEGQQFGDTTICVGDTIFLNASGGGNHFWPNPLGFFADSIEIGPTDTTVYRTVANRNGCYGTIGDTAVYTVNVVPQPSAQFVSPFVACENEPSLIYFFGPYTPNFQNSYDSLVFELDGGIIVDTVGIDSFLVVWADTAFNKTISMTNITPFCERTSSTTIDVLTQPQVSAGSGFVICEDAAGDTLNGSITNQNQLQGANCFVEWTPYAGLSNPFDLSPVAAPDTTITYAIEAICSGCTSDPDSVTVEVNERPTAVIDTFLLTVCAGGSIDLPGGGFGGSSDLSYQWFPSAYLNDPFLAVPTLVPGDTITQDTTIQYKLVVTDNQTGCKSDTAYIQVIFYPLPEVNAGPDQVICEGSGDGVFLQGSVIAGGFGSYDYSWTPATDLSDPNALQPFATPTQTTIYSLQVTNTNTGCTSLLTGNDTAVTTTVEVIERPVANAGPDDTLTICPGGSVQIGGVPSGAGPNYSYFWTPAGSLDNPNAQFPNASPNHITKYYVQVESNGCLSDADSVVVAVDPAPVFRVDDPFHTVCEGDSVQIGAAPPAGTGWQFSWSPANGLSDPSLPNPLASPASTTTYTLTVNKEGCPSQISDTVQVQVVEPPVIDIPQDSFRVCPDYPDSLQLLVNGISSNVQPIDFAWTPNIAIDDTTLLSPMVKPDESTVYTITAVAGVCSSSADIRVFVLPRIDAQILVDNPDSLLCDGESRTLTATGGLGQEVYTWLDNGSNDPIRTVTPAEDTTTYTVVVEEAGCSDTASVNFFVFGQPSVGFNYSVSTGCDDQQTDGLIVNFEDQSVGAAWWSWDFGDGSPISNEQSPLHTYTLPQGEDQAVYSVRLRVAAEGGCDTATVEEDIVVVQRRGVAEFISSPPSNDTTYLPHARYQFTDQSQNAVSYFWEFGDGQTSTEVNPSHTYQRPGIYEVTLTIVDPVGCIQRIRKGSYIVLEQELRIANVFTPGGDDNAGDGINDFWAPKLPGEQDYEAYVFDRYGNQIISFRKGERWDGTNADGNVVPEGVYFYILRIKPLEADEEERIVEGNITLLR